MIKNILKRMIALSLAGCLVLTGCNETADREDRYGGTYTGMEDRRNNTVWKVPGGGHIYARENDRNEQFQFTERGYLRG